MNVRMGHVNIFTGTTILLSALYYGATVNNLIAEVQAYFIGCLIVIVGTLQLKDGRLEERIGALEENANRT